MGQRWDPGLKSCEIFPKEENIEQDNWRHGGEWGEGRAGGRGTPDFRRDTGCVATTGNTWPGPSLDPGLNEPAVKDALGEIVIINKTKTLSIILEIRAWEIWGQKSTTSVI